MIFTNLFCKFLSFFSDITYPFILLNEFCIYITIRYIFFIQIFCNTFYIGGYMIHICRSSALKRKQSPKFICITIWLYYDFLVRFTLLIFFPFWGYLWISDTAKIVSTFKLLNKLLVDLFLGKWKLIYDILHCTIIGACNNNIIFRNDLWKYANRCVVKIYCLFCSLDRPVS